MPNNIPTSQPTPSNIQPDLDSKPYPGAPQQQEQHDPFAQHDANDAANGLFMLAQARGSRNGPQQFAVPQQPQQPYPGNMGHMAVQQLGQRSQDSSPNLAKRAAKNSVASNMSGSTQAGEAGFSDSGASEQARSAGRPKGKKASNAKGAANGRRKADETPSKTPAIKRQKGNNGMPNHMDISQQMEDENMSDEDMGEEQLGQDGKKMTDEEKRKNFLERNRVAALKCRQRKKQWLANLQQKVEIFSTENDALAATVTQLREEIVSLKTLLIAHKDCPVSQAQGLGGLAMQSLAGDHHQYANPYGMAMPQGIQQQGMSQANMQRRSVWPR
ncbi:hypothetical protein LTR28_012210 [Elasticomyces elasticus]|nr:hypothetical protein LTR28_012210 [Elasticomyces elasticus]